MANEVYANGMELACKAGSGKTICAFPDVCFTPPENPATPPGVPVPYPNTGFASDTTEGSKTVKITNKEVMLKNKSYFKKSIGDEAGCAAKKGVLSSTNTGKVYFIKWSMDVKFEGENVDRHLDLTTNNHNSPNANEAVPWPFTDAMAVLSNFSNCKTETEAVKKNCVEEKGDPCPGVLKKNIKSTRGKIKTIWNKKGGTSTAAGTRLAGSATKNVEGRGGGCARAMRCVLRPYSAEPRDGIKGCCPGQTPHHIPPWSTTATVPHIGNTVSHGSALCICLEGAGHSIGSHGKHHHGINFLLEQASRIGKVTKSSNGHTLFSGPLREHVKISAAVSEAQNGCSKECIEEQLNKQFGEKNLDKQAVHNASTTGGTGHTLMNSSDQNVAMTALSRPPAAPSIG
ncbi:MAG: PAAR-like domain-containing protein [Methylobacter sp.]